VVRIWIRPLNSLEAYPLPGTENALRPFWSPDSRYLAYFEDNQLKKVSVSGGQVQFICEAYNGSDGCWGNNGIIIFDGGRTDSIRQVPATGGTPTAATRLDTAAGERGHAWPWFLPDGNHFLYMAYTGISGSDHDDLILKVGSLDSDESKTIGFVGSRIEYCNPGYVLYMSSDFLVARPFDPSKLDFTGEPVPLANGVSRGSPSFYGANFGVSNNGTLVIQEAVNSENGSLLWIDRTGSVLDTVGKPAIYEDVALSPDQTELAYLSRNPDLKSSDIWVRNLARGVSTRLTFDSRNEGVLAWSPDGKRISYVSGKEVKSDIRFCNANGTGNPTTVYVSDSGIAAFPEWFESKRALMISSPKFPPVRIDISIFDFDHPDNQEILVANSAQNLAYGLSPDKRYLLYTGNESAQFEIYVLDLQGTGGKWQISPSGGSAPRWGRDGTEIYYLRGDDMMAVPVDYDDGFHPGVPESLFTQRHMPTPIASYFGYDVSADGNRFIFAVPQKPTSAENIEFEVTLNWFKTLGGE
jgi:Tol biopolymer transport system component